jgi:hypothetical protein
VPDTNYSPVGTALDNPCAEVFADTDAKRGRRIVEIFSDWKRSNCLIVEAHFDSF